MNPEDQEQHDLHDVLKALNYNVYKPGWLVRWGGQGEGDAVWRPGDRVTRPKNLGASEGPVCTTIEQAVAWIRDHVEPTGRCAACHGHGRIFSAPSPTCGACNGTGSAQEQDP